MSIGTPGRTSICPASPALSISSIIRQTNSTFPGQSPNLGSRNLVSLFNDSLVEVPISGSENFVENPILDTSKFSHEFLLLHDLRDGPQTQISQRPTVPAQRRY